MPAIRDSGIKFGFIIRRPGRKRITIARPDARALIQDRRELGNFFFFAVLALSLKSLALGAPLVPGLRIRSSDPSSIRLRLALMLAYNPGFFIFYPSGENGAAVTPPHSIRSG